MFVVLALPLLVLDGFNQHFQAAVHCSNQRRWLTSATSIFFPQKKIGKAGIWTWVGRVRSMNATSVLCRPPTLETFRIESRAIGWEASMLVSTELCCPHRRYVLGAFNVRVQRPLIHLVRSVYSRFGEFSSHHFCCKFFWWMKNKFRRSSWFQILIAQHGMAIEWQSKGKARATIKTNYPNQFYCCCFASKL